MSLLQRFNQNYKGIKMSNNAAKFTIRQLLEAGVHYGHRKNFWNPKMEKYIYGTRNGVHIVDLQKTAPMLRAALDVLKDVASKNGRVLFVGTKKSANELVAEQASRCGQYYVNHRWLGGMLTNWSTVSASIKTLAEYEKILADEHSGLNKKELLDIERKRLKLDNVLGGIRNMGGKPDVVFVIDRRQEDLAIQEARKLGIPVIAVVDTNSSPDDIDYVIPGNDDARKAIELYTSLAAEAILSGMQAGLASSGLDIKPVDMKDADIANSEMPETMEKSEDSKKKSATVVTKKKKPAAKAGKSE
jgi:small subunit ribosomal protein S2